MGGHLRALIPEEVHLLFTIQTAVVHMRADAVNSVALGSNAALEMYGCDPGLIASMQVRKLGLGLNLCS